MSVSCSVRLKWIGCVIAWLTGCPSYPKTIDSPPTVFLFFCCGLYSSVDRFPLITSAIINVDQDVDEPWPLEVYGHDGKATNVTMEPGDMVLYESHSVIHGRPFPLKGNYFANVFVHFEAVAPLDPNIPSNYDPVADLPPYLIPGSKWAATWRHQYPNGWKGVSLQFVFG